MFNSRAPNRQIKAAGQFRSCRRNRFTLPFTAWTIDKIQFFKDMNLIDYEIVPNGYGQIRFFPLWLANETTTLLEEWFINFKFLHFCINRDVKKDFFEYRLPVEFTYGRRVKNRTFDEIKNDAYFLIERSMFQELFRILVVTLEKANELYEISVAKKEGNSVLELRGKIDEMKREFHRLPFPEKIKKLQVKENFKQFLHTLDAVNKARNCFEHRNGILGKTDCNLDKKLVINFRFPAPVADDGKTRGIFEAMPIGKNYKPKIVEEKKTFRINQKLEIGFNDSYKLLYTIIFALKGLIDNVCETCKVTEENTILRQFKD